MMSPTNTTSVLMVQKYLEFGPYEIFTENFAPSTVQTSTSTITTAWVVDIRGLNAISVTDSYPLPLQGDVITKLQDCSHITVVDGSGQFHKFLVKEEYWDRFTIISYREKERSNVALMGFRVQYPTFKVRWTNFSDPTGISASIISMT